MVSTSFSSSSSFFSSFNWKWHFSIPGRSYIFQKLFSSFQTKITSILFLLFNHIIITYQIKNPPKTKSLVFFLEVILTFKNLQIKNIQKPDLIDLFLQQESLLPNDVEFLFEPLFLGFEFCLGLGTFGLPLPFRLGPRILVRVSTRQTLAQVGDLQIGIRMFFAGSRKC